MSPTSAIDEDPIRLIQMLAKATCVACVLVRGAGFPYDLMITVGRVADGVIENSRERLFTHLRAGDAEAAALEMEECLRILYWLRRLANRNRAGSCTAPERG